MSLTKATLTTLCLLLFATSLVLPVMTTMSQPLFTLASTLAEAVTTAPNLLSRRESAEAARLAERESVIATERVAKKAAQTAAADAERKLDTALARATAAERRTASLATELATKEVALADKASAKVVYRGKQRAIKEVVADSTQRVGSRLTQMLKADISAMVGQSIPYVGAVAVVGVTTFDAWQSCELMADLHELDLAFNPEHAIDKGEVCGMRVPTVDETLDKVQAAPGEAMDALILLMPDFQWEAGWKDLRKNLPEFRWEAGWKDLTENLPQFYWKEGWDDLLGTNGQTSP